MTGQLIKVFPTFLWYLKAHYRVYKVTTLDTVLSQLNPVHTLIPYFFKIHFSTINLEYYVRKNFLI